MMGASTFLQDHPLPHRTLVLIVRDDHVLLGEKVPQDSATSVGHGLLLGPGGKMRVAQPGEKRAYVRYAETPEECACREVKEESGLVVEPASLDRVALLSFYWPGSLETRNQLVHVYQTTRFSGEPCDTAEMAGWGWHRNDALPCDRMFEADRHWLPYVLEKKRAIEGVFEYESPKLLRRYVLRDAASQALLEEFLRL